METCRILISLRDLRFDGSADLGGNCRHDQRRHRQERYRCFVYAIIHARMYSIRDANGL